jgi:hypothetical protein
VPTGFFAFASGFGGVALRAGVDAAPSGGGQVGIGRGSWRAGIGMSAATPAHLDDLGPRQTMRFLDLAVLGRWRPEGRLAPTAGLEVGASRRTYAAGDTQVGRTWMPVVGVDAGVSLHLGPVMITPVIRTSYDLAPTALVMGDETVLQGTLGVGLGLELGLFFGPGEKP